LPPEKNHQQKANVYGRQEDDDNAHKLLTDKQVNTNQTGTPKETHQQGLQKPSPRGMLRRLTIPSLMPKERPAYTKYMLEYDYPTPNDRRHLLPNTALRRMLRKKA